MRFCAHPRATLANSGPSVKGFQGEAQGKPSVANGDAESLM